MGRHGWENFAALAMQGLASNHSKIPAMFPVSTLAKFSMWQDMNSSEPVQAQGALWAEVWRHEAVNPAGFPSCESAVALSEGLGMWDADLRRNFQAGQEGAGEAEGGCGRALPGGGHAPRQDGAHAPAQYACPARVPAGQRHTSPV